MSLEELLNKLVDVINNIQSVTGKYPIYLIGHNSTCNILLLLQKKIKTQGMILLFGGGETGKQRIIFRCRLDRFGRIKISAVLVRSDRAFHKILLIRNFLKCKSCIKEGQCFLVII